MKGQLTTLSDRRWKYNTGGKTKYIRRDSDGRWFVQAGDPDDWARLADVTTIDEAIDAVDGHRPATAFAPAPMGTGPASSYVPSSQAVVGCMYCSGPGATAECPNNPNQAFGVAYYLCACGAKGPRGHQCTNCKAVL